MDRVFPLGFPAPTAFYLVLYVLTFALHQALMHYVLAGSLFVAGAAVFVGRGDSDSAKVRLSAVLRDWMPFMLSAAITAGVAPLLFVQIVYQRHFYTANLLLGWRWMAVIPVLIVAFYLLYVLKASQLPARLPHLRTAAGLVAAASFVFVGFCWTANHVLAYREETWPLVYQSGDLQLAVHDILPRMLIWLSGAFATLSVIAGWQIWYRSTAAAQPAIGEHRVLGFAALGGVGVAAAAGVVWIFMSDDLSTAVLSEMAAPYLAIGVIGGGVQCLAWGLQLKRSVICPRLLSMASLGAVLGLIGVSVLREAVRLQHIDMAALFSRHQQSDQIGGFAVFLAFAAINTALIALCVWIVRRGWRPAD